MNRIRSKLNSRRGASISFGLLLFLVCAVVSAIVITAATASAGRMSQMARMDQCYYAVTSMGDLLRNKIDGQMLDVTYTLTADVNDATLKYRGDVVAREVVAPVSDAPEGDTLGGDMPGVDTPGVDTPGGDMPEGEAVPADSVSSEEVNYILRDATQSLIENLPLLSRMTPTELKGSIFSKTFDVTMSWDGAGAQPPEEVQLGCTINETLGRDRLLTFEIKSPIKDAAGNPYKNEKGDPKTYAVYLTFSSDVRDYAVDAGALNGESVVTWKLLSLQKHRPEMDDVALAAGGGT